MEEYKGNNERQSVVLEGMYRGVAGKIDEVRQSVSKELQYSSAQQANAYEAVIEEFKQGVEEILAELRYVSHQNSAIYDYGQAERSEMRAALLDALTEHTEGLAKSLTEHVDSRIEELGKKLSEQLDKRTAETQTAVTEYVDGRIGEAEKTIESNEAELIAEKLAEKAEGEETPEGGEEAAAGEKKPISEEDFDYEVLAEKIATILPETDYDMIADKVVAALPQTDEQSIADKVVSSLPQTDEQSIADRVAETITPTDYDLIGEKVAAVFEETRINLSDETVERIAVRVAELLRADDSDLERIVREASAEKEEPAEEPAEEELAATAVKAEPAPAPAPKKKAAEKKPAPAPAPKPAPVVVAMPEDESKTLRYKRSFIAKIIESDEDVKEYYSTLKNAILDYGRVRSQINWTNDRFTLDNESIIKIGVRGKTLCLYVALNPDEFPETVYHQKFAGDTKMYEKTPMMIKIKSGVAVKRGIRLIELLMERNGAVREPRDRVDYAAQYFFRTEEELLAEGLIKTAVVEKSDLDF